jgi:DNA-binding beta-propeller fold protein YncE
VANSLGNSISIINTATNQTSSTPGGSSARIVPTPEGLIRVQAAVVIPGVTGPWNILIVPSSTSFSSVGSSSVGSSSVETSAPKALVIGRTSNNVVILNLSTDQPESPVEVGTNPEQGDFDEELPRAIVTNFGSNNVSFVDTSGATASLSVPVGKVPVAVAVALQSSEAVPPSEGVPIADAGPDQTVRALSQVSLDGTSSFDPQGDPLSFLWTQTEGPSVKLSDSTSPTPFFRAPLQLSGSVVLGFELIVNDGQQDSLPNTVQVTVQGLRP